MSSAVKNVIVGTAGHIDHGKSSLVRALTGMDPDRLAEEKRRGITIDLGFAFLEMGDVRFGFVDVPGHERFVSNMLAGAAGIDMVLLVIAADESIKPQTREHFDICRMLGVQHGVVALTKSDVVDETTRTLAQLEVEEFLRGSFLENSPLVAVSAKSGTGMEELKQALVMVAGGLAGKDATRPFRLPIDRAFTMKGFGTVVTGTLVSGSLKAGEEVELLPGGQRLRVRGVQTAGRALEKAMAGQRTAVNLAGIDYTELARGLSLGVPGKFRATRRIDAEFTLLPGARKLKNRERVHFHASTTETVAELFLYGRSEIAPGETALAHLQLQDEVVVAARERFIARRFSPVTTIGGGLVLDPLARRPLSRDTGRASFLEALRGGDRLKILAAVVERASMGLRREELAAHFGWTDKEIAEMLQTLTRSGRVKAVGELQEFLVAAQVYDDLMKQIFEHVESFQRADPLAAGIAREELRGKAGRRARPELFRAALVDLVVQKRLELHGELVRRAGRSITLLPDEEQAKETIARAFQAAGLTVPSVKEVLSGLAVEARRAERLLHILLREKQLMRISPELIFHQEALAHLKARLRTYKESRGERISVPGFKDLTGITRKYAIPLLEYLDRERVTRRTGDERVIL